MVIVCFLEKIIYLYPRIRVTSWLTSLSKGKKKVGIKQAAKRENDFYRTLTFNMLQMENKVILTISSDYWKRTFFLKDKFPITKALTIKSHIANHVKLSLWEN